MNTSQIYQYLNELYPSDLSEPWDNDGIMVCTDFNKEITKILTTLDITNEVIDKAVNLGCEMIISHHPLIFSPLKSMKETDTNSAKVIRLIKENIAVISLHTRFDIAKGGLNDFLAKTLSLENCELFGTQEDNFSIGRTASLETAIYAKDYSKIVAHKLNSAVKLYDTGKPIKKVALVSGSGKDYIVAAKDCGADLYISGDLSYNTILWAIENGLSIIDAGHFATEIICTKLFHDLLSQLSDNFEIYEFSPNYSGEIIY